MMGQEWEKSPTTSTVSGEELHYEYGWSWQARIYDVRFH